MNSSKVGRKVLLVIGISGGLLACSETADLAVQAGMGPDPELPPPETSLIPTINVAEARGWSVGEHPEPAAGLAVQAFARGLQHPRWLLVLPNGDVLVAESNAPPDSGGTGGIKGWVMSRVMAKAGAGVPSANRITLLRDTDGDGVADQQGTFLDGLYSPFGMALVDDRFYVANADAVLEFPYTAGADHIDAAGRELVALPGGPLNHHWTKSLTASPDGHRLYVGVGSNSNVGENGLDKETGRAAIWEIDRLSGENRIYASGLRNPVGLTWVGDEPELWVSVNERDELGGDLVPDYMTSVQDGGFYGWPFSYFGQHVDDRVEPRPDLVASAIKPDYALGPHTGSLGLLYVDQGAFSNGMFVGQHGSWNRDPRSGYQVIFIPFSGGEPRGQPRVVLTGFLDGDQARGRPVGLAQAADGSLLVADDVGNTIWRVTAAETAALPLADARRQARAGRPALAR